MINLKQNLISELMNSNKGIHLSAYIENIGSIRDIKLQLREALDTAQEIMSPITSEHEIKRFLSPLDRLMTDTRALNDLSGNFAVYRTFDTFRMLPIPTEIEQICVLSDSFHIKPVLNWIQSDPGFLILTIERCTASVYTGGKGGIDFMDHYNHRGDTKSFQVISEWFNDWLEHNKIPKTKKIFIATNDKLTDELISAINRPNVFVLKRNIGSNIKIAGDFAQLEMERINGIEIDRKLIDFNYALNIELTQNNIADIARSAVRGEIAQLVVAKDVNIFGTINRSSGKLSINPIQLNHVDDDILDDLAQLVVLRGGQVITVNKDRIPGKRVAMAIRSQDRRTA